MKTRFVLAPYAARQAEPEQTLYITVEQVRNDFNLVLTDGGRRRRFLVGVRNSNGKLSAVRWVDSASSFADLVETDSAGRIVDIFAKDK
jgi:hypothetical protein